MKLSFSGTTEANYNDHYTYIENCIREHFSIEYDVVEYTSGGAVGVDTLAAYAAIQLYPTAKHTIYVPKGEWYNEEFVQDFIDGNYGEVIEIEGGYMKRNDALVGACDALMAFPKTNKEEKRSGTWATIRRAQRSRKKVIKNPLEYA